MTDPTTFIIDDVTFEGTLSIEIMEGTSVEIKACIFNSSDPVVIKAIPRVSNSDLEETKLALEKLEADLATQSADDVDYIPTVKPSPKYGGPR